MGHMPAPSYLYSTNISMGVKKGGKSKYIEREGLTFQADVPNFLIALKGLQPDAVLSDKIQREQANLDDTQGDDERPQFELGKGVSVEQAEMHLGIEKEKDPPQNVSARDSPEHTDDLPVGKSKIMNAFGGKRLGKKKVIATKESKVESAIEAFLNASAASGPPSKLKPPTKGKSKNMLSFQDDD